MMMRVLLQCKSQQAGAVQRLAGVVVGSRHVGRLAGKVSVVTGGGGALGRAQAIRLAEEGSKVGL